MTQPSSFAVLLLFARTAFRRNANRSAALMNAFRKKPAAADKPARTATLHRKAQRSFSDRFLGLFFAGACLLGTALLSFGSLQALTEIVRLDEMASAATIGLPPQDYERLRDASALEDESARAAEVEKVFSTLAERSMTAWAQKQTQSLAERQFENRGWDGFQVESPAAPWRGDLARLSSAGRLRVLRSIGVFLFLFNIGCVCLGLGLMKNLSQADPELVWLFQFPVSRPLLFLSRLVENLCDTPSAPITAIVAGMVLYGSGASLGSGFLLALLAGLAAALGCSAVRLVFEVVLAQRCSRKTRGAAVSAAGCIGGLVLLFIMLCSNARVTIQVFSIAADLPPAWCFLNPFSLGIGTNGLSPVDNLAWWCLSPAMSLVAAAAAVWAAARLTAGGLDYRAESVRGARVAAPRRAPEGRLFRGLIGKELLQLRRQPEFLIQVLLAPVMILGLLYLSRPEESLAFVTRDAATMSVSIFAGAAYLLLVAAAGILRTELKTVWFLQCLPRSLADSIRTKSRVWGTVALAPCVLLLGGVLATRPGQSADFWIRSIFLLAYVWLFAEICFGVYSLGTCISNEQTVRFRRSTPLVPALLAAECGIVLYRGELWTELGLLVMFLIVAVAVRQKQRAELAWLSEPVESPPKQIDVLHGLAALYAFLFLRNVFGGLLQQSALSIPSQIGLAYCAATLVVFGIVGLWLRQTGRTIAVATFQRRMWRPVAAGLAATCLVGFVWVAVLQRTTDVAASANLLRLPLSLDAIDWEACLRVGMIVLAAPLFEEWLFRGLIYRSLRRSSGLAVSVVLTTLLFTAIHPASSSGAVAALAIATALVYEHTGRLYAPVLVHMGYNAFIMVLWTLPPV